MWMALPYQLGRMLAAAGVVPGAGLAAPDEQELADLPHVHIELDDELELDDFESFATSLDEVLQAEADGLAWRYLRCEAK